MYSRDLFDPITVERIAGHWKNLLPSIARNPDRPLSELTLLSEGEERQLKLEWNHEQAACSRSVCLYELFESQVESRPDAVALVFDEEQVTYRELSVRANRVAHTLRQAGAAPDLPIGLCVEPSPALIVGMLGILNSGAAYVPMDPNHPAARLELIANDAGLAALVTARALQGVVPEGKWPVIYLEPGDELSTAPMATIPQEGKDPAHLAYVIYTSGSTGAPKGVIVPQENVVHLLDATRNQFGFEADDVWTLFHSSSFDFAVWEIWGALGHGGRLVIVPYWTSRAPEQFSELLIREQVTILNQTPSAFRQLVRCDIAAPSGVPALRWVVFGGEALDPSSLEPWFARYQERAPGFANMYGITETTVHVTHRQIGWDDLRGASFVGRAIPGWQAYVLDGHLQLAPVGAKGEICVGGAGLARGYLRDPALTAQRRNRVTIWTDDPRGASVRNRRGLPGCPPSCWSAGRSRFAPVKPPSS